MSSTQPAFGGMFRQLIELGVIEINTEPLDARIERRLKEFWENTSCPRCGHQRLITSEKRDRVRCRDCNFKPVYTYGTPFHEKHLSCGEVLLAFILYADTLLSINQIAFLLSPSYKTLRENIRAFETAFCHGFPTIWDRISQTVGGPTQVDETQQVCSGFKGQEPPREGSTAAARQKADGHDGRESRETN